MSHRVVGALVVLLAAAAGGVLFVGGPAPGESPGTPTNGSPADPRGTTAADATTADDATTEGTASNSGDTDGNSAATRTTTATQTRDSEYDFTIEKVEKCGTTCRDVTARLANAGTGERTNVQVTTKVYAKDDLLWTGNETVGALAPGEAHTSTKRVDVGLSGAMKIQNNDGYVTIVTVVRSDEGTTRFSERRKVS